jgi:hypothetical protein
LYKQKSVNTFVDAASEVGLKASDDLFNESDPFAGFTEAATKLLVAISDWFLPASTNWANKSCLASFDKESKTDSIALILSYFDFSRAIFVKMAQQTSDTKKGSETKERIRQRECVVWE